MRNHIKLAAAALIILSTATLYGGEKIIRLTRISEESAKQVSGTGACECWKPDQGNECVAPPATDCPPGTTASPFSDEHCVEGAKTTESVGLPLIHVKLQTKANASATLVTKQECSARKTFDCTEIWSMIQERTVCRKDPNSIGVDAGRAGDLKKATGTKCN